MPDELNRDLFPHKEARLAMSIWAGEYANSRLGSMGFWDQLPDARKKRVRYILNEIEEAPFREAPADGRRDIHTFFGLTYSSYLVLPRLLLQSLPEDMQHALVTMLKKIEELYPIPSLSYRVTRVDPSTGRFMSDPFSNYRRGDIHAALASVAGKVDHA